MPTQIIERIPDKVINTPIPVRTNKRPAPSAPAASVVQQPPPPPKPQEPVLMPTLPDNRLMNPKLAQEKEDQSPMLINPEKEEITDIPPPPDESILLETEEIKQTKPAPANNTLLYIALVAGAFLLYSKSR
jgi:hypothetical protein